MHLVKAHLYPIQQNDTLFCWFTVSIVIQQAIIFTDADLLDKLEIQ